LGVIFVIFIISYYTLCGAGLLSPERLDPGCFGTTTPIQLQWRQPMADDWIVLDEVAGMLQAEILRGLLEAQEIPTVLSQEGAGRAMGLIVGSMGNVQVLVPARDQERARELIDAYYTGAGDEDASAE
jgi:hypothetical protein